MNIEKILKIIERCKDVEKQKDLIDKYENLIKKIVNNNPDYYRNKEFAKKYFK